MGNVLIKCPALPPGKNISSHTVDICFYRIVLLRTSLNLACGPWGHAFEGLSVGIACKFGSDRDSMEAFQMANVTLYSMASM